MRLKTLLSTVGRQTMLSALVLGMVSAMVTASAVEARAAVDLNPLKVVLIGDSYSAGNGELSTPKATGTM